MQSDSVSRNPLEFYAFHWTWWRSNAMLSKKVNQRSTSWMSRLSRLSRLFRLSGLSRLFRYSCRDFFPVSEEYRYFVNIVTSWLLMATVIQFESIMIMQLSTFDTAPWSITLYAHSRQFMEASRWSPCRTAAGRVSAIDGVPETTVTAPIGRPTVDTAGECLSPAVSANIVWNGMMKREDKRRAFSYSKLEIIQ